MEDLSAAPEDWSTTQIERHFTEVTGVDPQTATAAAVRRYLDTAYPVPTVGAS